MTYSTELIEDEDQSGTYFFMNAWLVASDMSTSTSFVDGDMSSAIAVDAYYYDTDTNSGLNAFTYINFE